MKKILLVVFIIGAAAVDIYFLKLLFEKKETINKPEKELLTQTPAVQEPAVRQEIKEEKSTEEKESAVVQKNAAEVEKKTVKSEEKQSKISSGEKTGEIPEGYMVAKEYVNLREKPKADSKVVVVIRKGAMVKIIGKKANHWKRVLYSYKNRVYEGWVDDRFFITGGVQESR